MHIAISGNIGSGKTTLTEKLAKHLNFEAEYESVENNPYLADFYEDMDRWAFHLQIYFLNSRINQVKRIQKTSHSVVQDRTIYEDAHIFAKNLYLSGHINERDYQNYQGIFDSMIDFVTPPDLLIYLRADIPKLIERIQKRARQYEVDMHPDYLKSLNIHYEDWIGQYDLGKLLIVDVNNLDFVEKEEDFSFIVEKVDVKLYGLLS